MRKGLQIAPSIMGADFGHLADAVAEIREGGADIIHVDVMDGRYVPDITFGPMVVRHLRRLTELPLDVHMMVVEPERHVRAMAEAGASSITVHAEASVHLQRTLSEIRALGKKAGVALNPGTPASSLQYVLHDVDLVLVMTVNPGYLGQSFLPHVVPKITEVRRMVEAQNLDVCIAVDGGIGPKTAGAVVRAGAELLVAGSAVFNHADKRQAIQEIREAGLQIQA